MFLLTQAFPLIKIFAYLIPSWPLLFVGIGLTQIGIPFCKTGKKSPARVCSDEDLQQLSEGPEGCVGSHRPPAALCKVALVLDEGSLLAGMMLGEQLGGTLRL